MSDSFPLKPMTCYLSFDPAAQIQAQTLAARYDFVLNDCQLPRLHLTPEHLMLCMPHFSPMFVDFKATLASHRLAAGKKLALVKAVKPEPGLQVVDLTAGWGRDATILAAHGAQVCLIERQAIMAALLEDGLQRLPTSSPLKAHLSIQWIDALTWLRKTTEQPDVIYIDPMHPERKKSALVKKEMQMLQQLFGPDDDAMVLIQLACQKAKKRVVVKWPQKSPSLIKPDYSLEGKTVKFDVYTLHE